MSSGTKSLKPCPKCRESCISGSFLDVFWVGCESESCAYQLEYSDKTIIDLHNLLSEAAHKKMKQLIDREKQTMTKEGSKIDREFENLCLDFFKRHKDCCSYDLEYIMHGGVVVSSCVERLENRQKI
jgi:hypothetical protein